jgi:peptidoglycan-N-acetylglucosamine deacetylase
VQRGPAPLHPSSAFGQARALGEHPRDSPPGPVLLQLARRASLPYGIAVASFDDVLTEPETRPATAPTRPPTAGAYVSRIGHRVVSALAAPWLGPITHVETREPVAALTFDDGPDARWTPRVLELLTRHGARGTFFVVGEAARRHPDLVGRIVAGGHALGNHTHHHVQMTLVPRHERLAELRACEAALGPHSHRLFRPPHGALNAGTLVDAAWLGYDVIAWTVDVGDWWCDDPELMATALARRVGPGRVILFHDVLWTAGARPEPELPRPPHVDRQAMLVALDAFLAATSGRLRFVTVPELLRAGRPVRRRW